jgi:hypothetical protein|tara:strand:- start:161 stop:349 length:189 start_codon:yes stop_codon:yes gene_type:complete
MKSINPTLLKTQINDDSKYPTLVNNFILVANPCSGSAKKNEVNEKNEVTEKNKVIEKNEISK